LKKDLSLSFLFVWIRKNERVNNP